MKLHTAVCALVFAAGSVVPCALTNADPMETATFAGPYGVFASSANPGNTTLSVSFTAVGYAPGGVRVVMDLAAMAGAEGTLLSDVTVVATPPVGEAFEFSMGDFEVLTTATDVTKIVSLPAGVSPAGEWTFRVYDASQQGDGVAAEASANNVRVSLESVAPPAPMIDLGLLQPGTVTVPTQFLGAGAVHWCTFSVPALDDVSAPRYLDVITSGQFVDSYIGVYGVDGRVRAIDDDSGTGRASFLSFGYGGGSTVEGGGPSDAAAISDGRSGKLEAGEYWLAIAEFGGGAPVFAPGWNVQPAIEGAGFQYTLTLTLGATPGGGTPPAATPVGMLMYPDVGEAEVEGSVIVGALQPAWLSFTTGPVSADAGTYLDIVIDISSTVSDPEIGLYTAGGVLAGIDDDDGPDFASFLSLGAGGGTTIGENGVSPTASDGRDGNLTAGTYYLAVGEYNTTFANAFGLSVVGGEGGGLAVVEFRTGRVEAVGGCGPADVGVAGGELGHDGLLDNNDFIAFINYFFEQDPVADMGVAGGGPGTDGLFDNNDFIAFITHFFEGC